jgi:Rrf2 family protein
MLITRTSDYAMRIIRILSDNKLHNVREICQQEEIPKAFAYKIMRELEMNGFVKSERGNQGGYRLDKSLSELTLYDVISITEGDLSILGFSKEEDQEDMDTADLPSKVRDEVQRIQSLLDDELMNMTLADIMNC